MSVIFHPDGSILIDDPEIERDIAGTRKITGESPDEAVIKAVQEALDRRNVMRAKPSV
jgi:hypothetical protein